MKRVLAIIFLVALTLLVAGCGTASPTNAEASNSTTGALPFGKAQQLTIPAGTTVAVRLQTSVSSANAAPGQQFDAVLDEPLEVNGVTVAPRGAAVVGRVVSARSSGRLHNPGYLRLALASIEINGKSTPVESSSIFIEGKSHKDRNLAMIGGGAAGGALIGALAGGGKGALIGSAIGAGAGTTGAYATGKKDVGFGAERRLVFRLTQPVSAS
jgi:hypothetical protein